MHANHCHVCVRACGWACVRVVVRVIYVAKPSRLLPFPSSLPPRTPSKPVTSMRLTGGTTGSRRLTRRAASSSLSEQKEAKLHQTMTDSTVREARRKMGKIFFKKKSSHQLPSKPTLFYPAPHSFPSLYLPCQCHV